MPITLITGGNKGLGREAARRLLALGHTVYLGARDPDRGQAAADELGARFLPLDVTDDASVEAAVAALAAREGRLDVLVNNAGIAGLGLTTAGTSADDMRRVFETNVFGIVRMTRGFLPLLRAAAAGVIVNVGSGLGSFGLVTDPARIESRFPALAYGASKAAVSMLTLQYARGLPDLRINAVDPGPTSTDLNNHMGRQTVEEGTDAIVRLATIGPDGPTGTFSDRHGPLPW
jgi:NAD(P)-dependent dehydrogenase (short-subunit alcohol dehydrogenase family)